MFQLTPEEKGKRWSQIATLDKGRGRHTKYLPYVITEHGVAMLSSVLHSDRAIDVKDPLALSDRPPSDNRWFVATRGFWLQNQNHRDLVCLHNTIAESIEHVDL